MAKRGRPSLYTPEIADAICERLANGESLRSICRDENMPDERTVRDWVISDHNGFSPHYTRARDIALDRMADDVIDIADTADDPQKARLRFDARRWYLSKLAPKRYGDKLLHTGGDGEGPVMVVTGVARAGD